MDPTRRGVLVGVAAAAATGVVAGDDGEFDPEIAIGNGGLFVRVDSDPDPELVTIHTADGTEHEFTTALGRFEGGYEWGGRAAHHIDDGWYGPIDRVEAKRGTRSVSAVREGEIDLEVTCSQWKTPDIPPTDFRIRYEHASKRYDPPAGDQPAYGSPGRVIQVIEDGSYQLRINFDNRQDCQPEADRGVVFDCTSVTVYPEEFVNGVEEIYHPQLTFADGTRERLDEGSDEPIVPPATFEGTGDNEGKVIEQLWIDNDPGGEAMFGYTNPDVSECQTDGGESRTIDSPTVIDEPGAYELVADIDSPAREFEGLYTEAGIWVRANDVTIEGNGHTLSGEGNGVGIMIGDGDESSTDDVVVRDLRVEGWGTGISLGSIREWRTTTVLEDVTVTDNSGKGVFLFMADGSALEQVSTKRNGGHGIELYETADITVEELTASANGGHGIRFWDLVSDCEFTDVTVTDNGRAGIDRGIDVYGNTYTGLTVTGNDGPGISASDGGADIVRNATIADNGGEGVLLHADRTELANVSLRGNEGWQVDARDGSSVTATELRIGETAEVEASAEPISLDAVAREEFPDLPDDVRAVGDGVVVVGIEESVWLRLEYETGGGDGDVELWRHHGDDWVVVDSTDVDGAVSAEATEDGVYAPVVASGSDTSDDTEEEEGDPEQGSDDEEGNGDGDTDGEDGDTDGEDGDEADEQTETGEDTGEGEEAEDGADEGEEAEDDTDEGEEAEDGADEGDEVEDDANEDGGNGEAGSEGTDEGGAGTETGSDSDGVESDDDDTNRTGSDDNGSDTDVDGTDTDEGDSVDDGHGGSSGSTTGTDSSSVEVPGMGVVSGLAAFGGAGYLSVRYLRATGEARSENDG